MLFSTLGICPVLTIALHLWVLDVLLDRLLRRPAADHHRAEPWFALAESSLLMSAAGLLLTVANPVLDVWQERPVLLLTPWHMASLFSAKLLLATGSRAVQLALSRQAILPAIQRLGPSIILRSLGSTLMIAFAAWAIWVYILFAAAYMIFLAVDLAIWLPSRRWQTGSLLAVPLEVTAFFVIAFLWMLVAANSDHGFFAGIVIVKVATIYISIIAQKGIAAVLLCVRDRRHIFVTFLRTTGVGAIAYWLVFHAHLW